MAKRRQQKPVSPFPSLAPGVVLPPGARLGFQKGIATIAGALRPTLGPLPRLAAVARPHRMDSPELLDDGGLIARRIVGLKQREADMGAMFARHVLWRLHEEVGDGTATAAVMLQALVDEGVKLIGAGLDPMLLRGALEGLLPLLLAGLEHMALGVEAVDERKHPGEMINNRKGNPTPHPDLAQFAASICPDGEIAGLLGEIFSIIGENGHLEIQNGRGQRSQVEYIEGSFWQGGLATPSLMNDLQRRVAHLENCAILATDMEIKTAKELLPVLQTALAAGTPALVVLARKFSDDALALLVQANRSGKLKAAGVKTPGATQSEEFAALHDLLVLTGGRLVLGAAGFTLEQVQASDFGLARRVWADSDYFGIINGKGDPLALRKHIAGLEAALDCSDSAETRRILRTRIGRLRGGAARLLVGGTSESEQKHRRAQAERASLSLRSALKDGVLPGGGAALLALRGLLAQSGDGSESGAETPSTRAAENRPATTDTLEQRAARRMLQKALEAPARAIAANAGYPFRDPPAGMALDALSGDVRDMLAAGILDAAGVQKAALTAAVHGAALALTVDVLVQHANPQFSTEP